MWNSKSCPEGIPRERNGATAAKLTTTKINAARAILEDLVLDWSEGMRWHEHTASLQFRYKPMNTAQSCGNIRHKIYTLETYWQKHLAKIFSSRGGTSPKGH